MLLIKLGGAVIAPKHSDKILDEAYLKDFFDAISALGQEQIVLVHGTGSFGHGFVKKYGLNTENQHLLRAQLDDYFAVIDGFLPDYMRISASRLMFGDQDISSKKCIVIGGDIDDQANIISSDDVFSRILEKHTPRQSFLLTDVDGVLDTGNQVITRIDSTNKDSIPYRKKPGDVTGSMSHKIQKLFQAKLFQTQPPQNSTTVRLLNAYNIKNRQDILAGRDGIGTKIVLD